MGPDLCKNRAKLFLRDQIYCQNLYLLALASLHDDVEEIPYSEIQKIVEDEIRNEDFQSFFEFETQLWLRQVWTSSQKPVFAFGKEVAVKIQGRVNCKNFIEDLDR
jgi:predicted unusual protein kinase regulating ubiquinone biosynthesis (AarF/ABC1/UbiB family)